MFARAVQKTACLVLDNPGRDLFGLGLLGAQLALRGIRVVLVPMYDQQQHVTKELPDYVLLNYARKANTRAIRLYRTECSTPRVESSDASTVSC
jgi:hypothetical protein